MNNPCVLFVDDDLMLARALSRVLEQNDFAVVHVTSPSDALKWLRAERPNLIILDVDLQASLTGYDLARLLRQGGWTGSYALRGNEFVDIPILMLTGHDQVDEQLTGYEAGVDQYMSKQDLRLSKKDLDARLLVAQLRALLNRNQTPTTAPDTIRIGQLFIHLSEERVVANAKPVDLTPTEYCLLRWLAQHTGVVQSREVLLAEVWQITNLDAGSTRVVDATVRRLRKKLTEAGCGELIQSKHGVGYVLSSESDT